MQKTPLLALLLISSVVVAQDVKVLDLEANDIIYLPSTGRLYISTSEGVEYGNSLCVLNPYHGTIETCYTIGGSPGALAFSDDEKYIYIGLQTAPEIVRFDVGRDTIDLRISLKRQDNSAGHFYAEDIAVVPGNPEVIAVSLMNPKALPRHAGVAIYEHETMRPVTLPDSTGSNSLTFDTETGFLYGYKNETNTDLAIRKMSVNDNGVFVESTTAGLLDRPYDEIKYANGKLYANFGKVISLSSDTPVLESSFSVGSPFPVVEPVADSNIVFFLSTADAAISFETFDKESNAKMDQLNFPNIKGNPYKLVQWGGGGKVACVTRDFYSGYHSRVVIMRTCVSAITEIPTIEYSGPFCSGDTVRLYVQGPEGPVFWSNGQTGPVAELIYNDAVFCSIADELGCLSPASAPLLVSFSQYPYTPDIYQSDDGLFLYSSSDYGRGMQWYLNGEPIPGANSSAIELKESGTYTFQVDWDGCLSGFSNEITVIISSLGEPGEDASYRLFPNPATDRAFLQLDTPAFRPGVIRISGLDGRLLSTQVLIAGQVTQEISLERLPAGLYIFQAFDNEGRRLAAGRLVRQ